MNNGKAQVSIITVNYKVAHLVEGLLKSIEKHPPSMTWEMIVVDNASGDDEVAHLKRLEEGRSNFRVIASPSNVGFGAGNNIGVKESSGDILIFLNPDMVVGEGCLDGLIKHLGACRECGIAAPRICFADGSFQPTGRAFPNPLTGLFGRATLLTKLFPRNPLTRRQLIDLEHTDKPSAVDWAAGMAWAVRREEFERVGGWDERYFMYWEDADVAFAYKHKLGLETHYIPSAKAMHYHAESSSKLGPKAVREFHDSAYKYVVKNLYPGWYDPRRWFSWAALKLRANMIVLKRRL
jgi:N-acetylglucosaminyl-diphospho-decaprenol L-rhamnosyltransferase